MQEHWHADALQQEHQQRKQFWLRPRSTICREDDRSQCGRRGFQQVHPFRHGAIKSKKFHCGFALHAQRAEAGAEYQVWHAAIKHRGKQVVRVSLT
jgi:hypothetical protein